MGEFVALIAFLGPPLLGVQTCHFQPLFITNTPCFCLLLLRLIRTSSRFLLRSIHHNLINIS